ncbi:Oxysterol-binding protein [Patellaria atrata CBS 101060]|uniref:Oxysterol-binding protein n=1 Tax=Patellaria atrata CBS 101060 TaxID=1346257 RepID=A0A9P4SAH2_9PEZI|nr:Oxysterol-binding protein [Patellaria atrata CBS 101060]
MSTSTGPNNSGLKSFLASLSTVKGNLSNITAPPFLLAPHSTTSLPQYQANRPSLFVAPALEPRTDKRALLVLKRFLASLRGQQYAGSDESDGVKKPLNAFLGELFLGSFEEDGVGEIELVVEQVSHHPPVTACYLYNARHGVSSQGFAAQEVSFSGSVSVKQRGYTIVRLERFEEDYLVPLPDVKVKGVLGGVMYPEITGAYAIVGSSGFVSEIQFGEKGFLGGGERNGFEARVFAAEKREDVLFTVEGRWDERFTVRDGRTGETMEVYDTRTALTTQIRVADIAEQDPWESRRAWGCVIDAMKRSDMQATANEKSILENGQREMRNQEQAENRQWKPVFFKKVSKDRIYEKLAGMAKTNITVDREGGIWKVDLEAILNARRPFHDGMTPRNQRKSSNNEQSKLERSKNSETDCQSVMSTSDFEETQDEAKGDNPNHKEQREEQSMDKINHERERIQIEEFLRNKYSSAH